MKFERNPLVNKPATAFYGFFTSFFTDIFSYISKTTGPILMRFSVTCSDGSSEHVCPRSFQNRSSSFRDIAKYIGKKNLKSYISLYLENYWINFDTISDKHVGKVSGNMLPKTASKSVQ